ncbi:MAG: hypothetical protein BMS9Abin11_0098 [Gammaproteobacteria bacterium]|nr:MAG: hypothetical protein BMS9Abin11_0098 [Gammaproteobacteria bacterium]
MHSESYLIAMDSSISLRKYGRLQNTLTGLQGVYQTYFHFIKPQCQGLMVKYNPEETKSSIILARLRTSYLQVHWHGCYPGEKCSKCKSALV